MTHLTLQQLEAGLEEIRKAPKDRGIVAMIVRRPRVGEREVLEAGELDPAQGLAGDTWKARGSKKTTDGSAHPDMQLTVMNVRAIALMAQEKSRWPLAGDQLYLDFDISDDNLPPGTRLSLGSAVIEISELPHTGCHQFAARFGVDAMKFVNSPVGKQLHLRGVNAKIVQPGRIRVGEVVAKVPQNV